MKKITIFTLAILISLATPSCGIIIKALLYTDPQEAITHINISTDNYWGLLWNKLDITVNNESCNNINAIELELTFKNQHGIAYCNMKRLGANLVLNGYSSITIKETFPKKDTFVKAKVISATYCY